VSPVQPAEPHGAFGEVHEVISDVTKEQPTQQLGDPREPSAVDVREEGGREVVANKHPTEERLAPPRPENADLRGSITKRDS
jgi:hypothetical protein